MSSNITLQQAAEQAHQLEIISLMIESYPNKFTDGDFIALASLMAKLSGNVTAFLIEKSAMPEATK
ncbi:hypothetical protein EKQ45_08050 [Proteus vulgaris]|uniref:hypothetical protein n=1 Tax=Proteus mirabilis TaxID=584 RepID=UPI0013741EF6|nr:hypothetical protein [Proteus mirabilis]QHP75908.1 hypothetical protein EKQ45_08050 [Proteus vulgaris]QIM25752.1 hypothetical protein G9Q98_13470 [Proteus mirabilis]